MQMLAPRVQVIRAKGKMIGAPARNRSLGFFPANQMQLLSFSKPEPRTRKIKGRPFHALEPQNAGVEFAALFHIAHQKSDVIQFPSFHSAADQPLTGLRWAVAAFCR